MGKMHNRGSYAVSEVVGYILIIVIIATTISFVSFWYVPHVEKIEAETQVNGLSEQFKYFADAVDNLISQGVNASTVIPLSFNEGNLYVESIKNAGSSRIIGERIVLYYSLVDDPNYDFNVSGLDDSDENFAIDFDLPLTTTVRAQIYNLFGSGYEDDSCTLPAGFDFGSASISGAYKINLFDEDNSSRLFGRIWVFDTGSFIYELNTGMGTYHVSLENGAVLNGYPTSSIVDRKPVVFYENNNLVLYMLQINTTNDVGVGGTAGGDIDIHATLTNNTILEDRNISYNFKMQFFNDNFESDTDAWKVFYQIYHGFVDSGPDDIKFDNTGSLKFTLVRSICDVRLEV